MTRVLYVGLDVSLEMTSICVVDAEGGMILETKAVSDPVDIGEVLAGIASAALAISARILGLPHDNTSPVRPT